LLAWFRIEQTAKSAAERAIVDGAANLEEQISATPRPTHLLGFVHSPVDPSVIDVPTLRPAR
jgi:hypothetical protein